VRNWEVKSIVNRLKKVNNCNFASSSSSACGLVLIQWAATLLRVQIYHPNFIVIYIQWCIYTYCWYIGLVQSICGRFASPVQSYRIGDSTVLNGWTNEPLNRRSHRFDYRSGSNNYDCMEFVKRTCKFFTLSPSQPEDLGVRCPVALSMVTSDGLTVHFTYYFFKRLAKCPCVATGIGH
jgi:hypothetical protein